MAASSTDNKKPHVHVAFCENDNIQRFAELLEIPKFFDEKAPTQIQLDILEDFEIDERNIEALKLKISKLAEKWIKANPQGYLIYQSDFFVNLRTFLDFQSFPRKTMEFFQENPETVKFLQSSRGYGTGRIDGNIHTLMEDYNNLCRFKKAILWRNTKLFNFMLYHNKYELSPSEQTQILFYAADLGRIDYLERAFEHWVLDYDFDFQAILDKDLTPYILERKETIFIMFARDFWNEIFMNIIAESPDVFIDERKYQHRFLDYFRLSVKHYLPNISKMLLIQKISRSGHKILNEVVPQIIGHDNLEVLNILMGRPAFEYDFIIPDEFVDN